MFQQADITAEDEMNNYYDLSNEIYYRSYIIATISTRHQSAIYTVTPVNYTHLVWSLKVPSQTTRLSLIK